MADDALADVFAPAEELDDLARFPWEFRDCQCPGVPQAGAGTVPRAWPTPDGSTTNVADPILRVFRPITPGFPIPADVPPFVACVFYMIRFYLIPWPLGYPAMARRHFRMKVKSPQVFISCFARAECRLTRLRPSNSSPERTGSVAQWIGAYQCGKATGKALRR